MSNLKKSAAGWQRLRSRSAVRLQLQGFANRTDAKRRTSRGRRIGQ